MNYWIEKSECTGCTACVHNCPVSAIKMCTDSITGFKYPFIDNNICINCGRCENTCPVYKKVHEIKVIQSNVFGEYGTFAARNIDDTTRYNSTSGGVFLEAAKFVIGEGGIVFGAAYDKDMILRHIGVSSIDGIKKLCQSKYVQSDLGDVYSSIKNILQQKKKVLFVGAPCQVAGLVEYLGNVPKGLYTIEFICLGVNSPKAYRSWIDELEKQHKSKVKNIWFKYKDEGWRKSPYTTKVSFCNGKEIILRKADNYYMKGYLEGNIYMRESCSSCHFMGKQRVGDITFGDFWGSGDYKDDLGTSIVLLNTQSGLELFQAIKKQFCLLNVPTDSVAKGNEHFFKPAQLNPNRKRFYKHLSKHPFSCLVKKYTHTNIITRIIRKLFSK